MRAPPTNIGRSRSAAGVTGLRRLIGVSPTVCALCAAAPAGAQSSFINWETAHVSPLTLTPGGSLLLAVNTPDQAVMARRETAPRPAPAAIPELAA